MKKESAFKLKSGNKPSPAKFFGMLNRLMGRGKKMGGQGMGAVNAATGMMGVGKPKGRKGKRGGILGAIGRMF